MLKILGFIKKLYARGASIFTVLLLLLYSVIELFPTESSAVLNYRAVLQLLAFSFLLSFVNFIFRIKAMSPVVKVSLHFIITTVIFYICFIACGGFSKNLGVTFAVIALYIVIYIAVIAICFLYNKLKNKPSKENKDDYKPQFSDK